MNKNKYNVTGASNENIRNSKKFRPWRKKMFLLNKIFLQKKILTPAQKVEELQNISDIFKESWLVAAKVGEELTAGDMTIENLSAMMDLTETSIIVSYSQITMIKRMRNLLEQPKFKEKEFLEVTSLLQKRLESRKKYEKLVRLNTR
jgi:hypothetical protein